MRLEKFPKQAVLVGLFLATLQLLLVLGVSPAKTAVESYSKLCAWDCGWYTAIAKDGYHSVIPPAGQNSDLANVAFFPGYPYLARALHLSTRLKTEISLLIIAQLFCVLFWATLWSVLKRWRAPTPIAFLVVLAVLTHPASFFLVAGYSESMFLSTLLIFVLGASRAGRRSSLTSAASGIVMSATRIVGIPVAGFPLLAGLSSSISRRKVPRARRLSVLCIASVTASTGALLFFLYCKLRFGESNLYMETQRIGWGITPDYGAIWKWPSFDYRHPYDRAATLASGFAFLAFMAGEIILKILGQNRGLPRRLPLYAISFLIFFITLSGLKGQGFQSMIRYTLPWYILLVLCLTHLCLRLPPASRWLSRILFALLVFGLIDIFYLYELPHLVDFLNGRWFA